MWGRGLSVSVSTTDHLTRSLHEKAVRTCNQPNLIGASVCVKTTCLDSYRQTKNCCEQSLTCEWGSAGVFASSHLVPVLWLGPSFFGFYIFSAGHRERPKLAETRNWRLLGGAVALRLKSLLFGHKKARLQALLSSSHVRAAVLARMFCAATSLGKAYSDSRSRISIGTNNGLEN